MVRRPLLFLALLATLLPVVPARGGELIRRTVEFLIERGGFVRAEALLVNLERREGATEESAALRQRLERRRSGQPDPAGGISVAAETAGTVEVPVVPAAGIHKSGTTRYAETLLQRGKEAEALERLQRVAAEDPYARLLLGRIHHEAGRHAEAMVEFRAGLALLQDAPAAFQAGLSARKLGEKDEAQRFLRLAAAWDPRSAAPCLVLGNDARAAGQFDEARTHYLEALKRSPQMVEAHLAMADTLFLRGDEQEAARTYAWILERFPAVADTCYLGLARILLKHQRVDEALKMIAQAEKVAPKNAQVYELRAALEEGRGRTKEALADWRRVLKLRPDAGKIRQRLIETLIARQEIAEAREEIQRALRDDPENGRCHYLLGLIHSTSRDWDLAEKHLQRARQDPGQALEALVALGIMREKQGRRREARELFLAGLDRAGAEGNERMIRLLRQRVEALGGKTWQKQERGGPPTGNSRGGSPGSR